MSVIKQTFRNTILKHSYSFFTIIDTLNLYDINSMSISVSKFVVY